MGKTTTFIYKMTYRSFWLCSALPLFACFPFPLHALPLRSFGLDGLGDFRGGPVHAARFAVSSFL